MNGPPPIGGSPSSLPRESDKRREALLAIFGRYVVWALEEAQTGCKRLVESPEARASLGTINAVPYEEIEKLPEEVRRVAFAYARRVAERVGRNMVRILGEQGISLLFGDDHAMRFKVVAEIVDRSEEDLLLEEVLNRGSEKAFSSYWNQWLYDFGKLKD